MKPGLDKPRLLMVARTRYALPLSPSLERKFEALRERFDLRVLATSADGRAHDDGTFRLVGRAPLLDGLLFWALLPGRIRQISREHEPTIVVAQSPFEGAAVVAAGLRRRLAIELHGDWRTFGRLYGSGLRRLGAGVLDAVGRWAVRRAAAVRAVSPYTAGLARSAGVEPADTFAAYMDFGPFVETPPRPLPDARRVLFVGVLERYKNVDGLAEAWRRVAAEVPAAELRIVGRGSLSAPVEALVADRLATWNDRLAPAEVVEAMDEAAVLVLPSRSEGMGRVVIEALLRGRPVVGARVGGIPDLVEDGVNGLLTEPAPEALAAALIRILSDRALLERLAANARAGAEGWVVSPEEYASRMVKLAQTLR